MKEKRVTYKDSGVDIEAGNASVQQMKKHIKRTLTQNVLCDVGGFGGLFALNTEDYEAPILVSGTDGVGTKLKIAFSMNKDDTIGEDCVAMCVNDILCHGAKPLFFLDYIATGKVEPDRISNIVKGIANGCVKAGAALIGGETAEMPGFYQKEEYDIAGFAVGIVDKKKLIDGSRIEAGDVIIGLPSTGLHSNGYSLARKVLLDRKGYKMEDDIEGLDTSLGNELLKPTRLYVDPVYELIQRFDIKGMSHITGGGFYENIPRILPKGLGARITIQAIDTPPIFEIIQEAGNIERDEMYRTFNMGVGMVLVADKKTADKVMAYLRSRQESFYVMGEIVEGRDGIVLCP